MRFGYKLYGLSVGSNQPLPALRAGSESDAPDLRIYLGDRVAEPGEFGEERFRRPAGTTRGDPLVKVSVASHSTPRFWFRYADGVEFLVDGPGRRIAGWWPEHFRLEDAAVYLLGPILGFYLRLLGTASLHASAFQFGPHAVVLLGPAGSGKSTLAAAVGRRGYSILSEDVAPIREGSRALEVIPGYPLIRLWPHSVEHLFGSRDAMPQLTPSWDKRSWSELQGGVTFGKEPLPLGAVYLLAPREETNAPRVESITAREALIGLVTNTYVNYLLSPEQRAKEFELLGRLVSTVPVRRLVPYKDIARLDELRECLLEDCRRVLAARS